MKSDFAALEGENWHIIFGQYQTKPGTALCGSDVYCIKDKSLETVLTLLSLLVAKNICEKAKRRSQNMLHNQSHYIEVAQHTVVVWLLSRIGCFIRDYTYKSSLECFMVIWWYNLNLLENDSLIRSCQKVEI